ncbi:ribonuclease H family protein [Lactiplantibacillus brownii]|uniref:ribonuclease H family protein n=1 Tax=Lactiplantibacillus brownii TaxID=3069269 RepID=UPI0038B250CA
MAKLKFYAVRVGRKPGIYRSWEDCQAQINHYSGAQYKSFLTREAATDYLNSQAPTKSGQLRAKKAIPDKTQVTSSAAVVVYTDGGNRNTGNVQGGQVKPTDKSAWAFQMTAASKTVTGTSGEWGATNNRMEIMALLQALSYLIETKQTETPILIVMDSKYVLDAIQKGWLTGWEKRGWRRAGNQPLENSELWRLMAQSLQQFSKLSFKWVKGHATTDGNNLVDHLLNETMDHMTKNAPIPAKNATAKIPGRPATSIQEDLFATIPQTPAPVKASTPSAADQPTPAASRKLGHLANQQAQQQSVDAMAEIAKHWRDD